MSAETAMPSVCFLVDTIGYETGGGHFWAYLNWALGAKSLGCRVRWLELVPADAPDEQVARDARRVAGWLAEYGLHGALAVCRPDGEPVAAIDGESEIATFEAAATAEVLVNFRYAATQRIVSAFTRSVLIDIDPGLLQAWIVTGMVDPARHDAYVTTGELVTAPDSAVPATGLPWVYVPQAVSIEHWTPLPIPANGRLTTVSHWYADEWVEWQGDVWRNDKRSGFLPFVDVASDSPLPIELALCLADDEHEERAMLERAGWIVTDSGPVSATPRTYQDYIGRSLGEFSCTKPSCQRIPTGWVSDRTLCYLASARPAIVQHTGDSAVLADADGVLRFRTPDEALRCIRAVADDPEHHAKAARALAEERFDARACIEQILRVGL